MDWKPHNSSMPMGRLAGISPKWRASFPPLLSEIRSTRSARWPANAAYRDEWRQRLLEVFDENVAGARAAISKASDEELYKTWTLMNGGKTFFSMPRIQVPRSMILDRIIRPAASSGSICA